jgi:hypothetical protein
MNIQTCRETGIVIGDIFFLRRWSFYLLYRCAKSLTAAPSDERASAMMAQRACRDL